jgi:hypothetical protein
MDQEEDYPVIASRRYYADPAADGLEIVVSIEQPFQDESGYFECGYRILGAENKIRYAAGGDGIHALIMALAQAGSLLQYLNEQKYDGKLRWDGGPAESSLPTVRDHWPFKTD